MGGHPPVSRNGFTRGCLSQNQTSERPNSIPNGAGVIEKARRMTAYFTTGLYEGEQLPLSFGVESPVVPHDKNSINAKYVKGEVRIITEQARYPLPSVVAMYEDHKVYVLNPDFQRRHRWDREKQSRLIESFIMNVPIPPIFLYEVE